MRRAILFLAAGFFLTFSACSSQSSRESAPAAGSAPARGSSEAATNAGGGGAAAGQKSDVSLVKASSEQPSAGAAAIERKIIRNAELVIESENPEESFRKVASLAESKGGFVVTSEASQQTGTDEPGRMSMSVVVRIPAAQFDSTIEEIRKIGSRVMQDKRTGQDVTEEFIDLDARLQAKRALEAQFLEIMKQARAVSDALEVQRQLADVRGEIEQIEGRRRFLENQSSLSTIKATITPPVQIIGTTTGGFFNGIKEAIGDGISAAATIILVLLRLVIALLPILLFVVLPITLAVRYWVRRSKRTKAS